jgi:hypothetical protein
MSTLDYDSLPHHLRGGMKRYFEEGIETGSFLRAVLEGDSQKSYSLGDLRSLRARPQIEAFLRKAPEEAWGTAAKVQAWIESHKPKYAI